MATPPLSDETLRESLNVLQRHGGNITTAAREMGIARSTLGQRKNIAEDRGISPSEPLPASQPPLRQTQASQKPRVRVRALTNETPPEGPIIRVLAIGDSHDGPKIPDQRRFEWFGKHIAETNPDYVVDIGDSCTFDSLCSYEGNDTFRGKLKPSVQDDLTSYDRAMELMADAMGDWKGRWCKTDGNHEDRLYSFENRNPEIFGMIKGEYRRILEKYNIQLTPYGEYLFIGGVGFIHTPMNGLGRPFGGETLNAIANKATFDIVFGHSHKQGVHRAVKIGPQNYVKIINLGSAMPWGHVEDYAKLATTGWWWGVVELMIQGGHVVSENFIPMTEMERRYG